MARRDLKAYGRPFAHGRRVFPGIDPHVYPPETCENSAGALADAHYCIDKLAGGRIAERELPGMNRDGYGALCRLRAGQPATAG
jgi:hypothetical protein